MAVNYNSIQEILDAGITNMTVIRNNSKQDDGTDTLSGVDWFTFNEITNITPLHVSGNSYFGFGANSEHLKVNRRDNAMWYLYREEGTLFDQYRFLKIRWSGYTHYSQAMGAYKLTYDVILWDTGDISLHMVDFPTDNWNGTFSLLDVAYTAPTAAMPDVTFKVQEDGTFIASNELIELAMIIPEVFYKISGSRLTAIADQIRRLTGTTDSFSPERMETSLADVGNLPAATDAAFGIATDNVETGIVSISNVQYFEESSPKYGYNTYTANEALAILGLRIYSDVTFTGKALKLLDSNHEVLRTVTISNEVGGEWVNAYFDTPVNVAAGETFTIQIFRTYDFTYVSASNVTFNGKLTFVGAQADAANAGGFGINPHPSGAYGIADVIISSVPDALPDSYEIDRATMDNIAEEVQRITGTETKMTVTQITEALEGLTFAEGVAF